MITITHGEYASRLDVYRNSLADAANTPNTPNGSEPCAFKLFNFVAFSGQLYTLQDIHGFSSTTFGVVRSTRDIFSEQLRAHRIAFSLSGSKLKHLEGSVWLFRVAELFSYNFQTILHSGNVIPFSSHVMVTLSRRHLFHCSTPLSLCIVCCHTSMSHSSSICYPLLSSDICSST
jgi:hypothetical protein